jgi:hypothetical protein
MIVYFLREIRPAVNLNFDTNMAQFAPDYRSVLRAFKYGSNDYADPTPMGPQNGPSATLKRIYLFVHGNFL